MKLEGYFCIIRLYWLSEKWPIKNLCLL